VSIPRLQEAGIEFVDLPPNELDALQNGPVAQELRASWVPWLLERKPGMSAERAEEIKQFYLTKLEEYSQTYPDTLEPDFPYP
jgi:hypothetical protein